MMRTLLLISLLYSIFSALAARTRTISPAPEMRRADQFGREMAIDREMDQFSLFKKRDHHRGFHLPDFTKRVLPDLRSAQSGIQ
ncbi:MAG TPA: hypothetical protein VNE41_00380 [Chitinophagaceae bacterium]|nr:hypothetical protein [Chitinophagaceae bacterium]